MGRIRVLGDDLVNRIAAGEVIERPASVVKELVENALDAGARRVEVETEDGGRRSIRVMDDGGGIEPDDLPRALQPHATSKLDSDADLFRIRTFGFRGEALASIGAVAQVRIVSRVPGSATGYEIECDAGRAGDPRPAAAREGTLVDVRHLFHSVPARRKFLKGPDVESEHVHDHLARFAVSHPGIALTYLRDGRTEFALPAGETVEKRLAHFHGTELADALLVVERGEPPFRFRAFVAPPKFSRLSLKTLQIFLNGRYIRDRVLQRAVGEAFREFVPYGRSPVAFVFLDVDPGEVDVNVHPTKIEVRFRSVWRVHDLLASAIREALVKSDIAPALPPADFAPPPGGEPIREIVEAFRGFDPPPAPAMLVTGRRYFQVHRRYIVEEAEDGIRIIDQHALHERVLLEELKKEFSRGRIASQRLLVPSVVKVTPGRRKALEEYRPLLESVGIDFEDFGPDAVAVRSVPALLADEDAGRIVLDFLERAEQAESDAAREEMRFATIEETLEFLACRGAVRFGRELAPAEIERLLSRRGEIEHAHSCAHGRPVAVKMTLEDLERVFQRK